MARHTEHSAWSLCPKGALRVIFQVGCNYPYEKKMYLLAVFAFHNYTIC